MTRPRTGGDLLSQRPHTTLPADEEDEDEADDEEAEDDSEDDDYLAPTGSAHTDDQLAGLRGRAGDDEMNLPRYKQFWSKLTGIVTGNATAAWQLMGPTPDAAAHVGNIVYSGQQLGSHLTQLYAAQDLGVRFTPFSPGPGITERPGVDKAMEFMRPIRERSVTSQVRRLTTLANTDLQLSKVRTLFSAFDEDQEVNRAPIRTYRRETTSEKPCALCEIASTQLYFTTDLMPIHDNCMCDVVMADEQDISEHEAHRHHIGWVEGLLDDGEQVKAIQSLADADADVDDYVNLTKIEQHGEIGPVMRWSGQKFTGPKDLPTPKGFRPVPSISGPGRGHEARLGRNTARVAQQRRQKGSILHYAEGHGGLSTYLPPTPKVMKPIPVREVPKIAPVVPIQPKGIDFHKDPLEQIVKGMSDKYSDRITFLSNEWYRPGWLNEDSKRQALQALDEMMTKYPKVNIESVGLRTLGNQVAGETTYEGGTVKSIMFDRNWMSHSPQWMKDGWSSDTSGFGLPSAAEDPIRQLVYHEFGHAIDTTGGRGARSEVSSTVVRLYNKSGRMMQWGPNDPPGKINRAVLHNQDDMRKWMSEPGRLSGYSMVDGYLPNQINPATGRLARVGLNDAEALAQAFAEVEIRGDKASEVSKALNDRLVHYYHNPKAIEATGRAAMKEPAVDQLRRLTTSKPNWTAEQIAKEDNYAKNAAGEVILSDEHRALARELATKIWVDGARVEPSITAAAVSSAEANGGFMSGLDFKQKTGPSLYRKIQAEAIDIAHGKPVTAKEIRQAADGIKDAVRYTAIFPEEGYWDRGDQLRKALESLGAKTIKDPVGIPLNGYRGRNMAFTLNGMPFEMQVNTELGVAIKDEAHQIYNVSRKLEADLKAKGIEPLDDPMYRKMLADMQEKWDSIPITKGTPVVQTEKDAKSGDLNKVLYTTDHTAYYGPSVPNGEAALSSAEMLARERVPSTKFGMEWLPDSPEAKIVAPAREVSDALWDTLPVQHLPQGTVIKANEGTLKKKSIDKVVGGKEPFREGYVVKLYQTEDGALHVVDGHTRIAMYHALDKAVPVRILDDKTLQLFSHARDDAELPAVTGLSADKKGWGSVNARLPEGTEIKPVYKLSKTGKQQLDVEATWKAVSDETLRENWRLALRHAAPWAKQAGADWYPGVHRLAEKLTSKYGSTFEKRWGIKLTPDLTASFFAAFSENNGWDGNLVGVRRLLDGTGNEYAGKLKDFKYSEASDYKGIKEGKYGTRYVIPADEPTAGQKAKLKEGKRIPQFQIPGYDGWYRLYDFHVNKALRAAVNPRGGIADLRENDATAPKPADFGANIAGDYSRATADRWVARIILHTDDGEFAESMRGFTKTKNKVPNRIGYQRMSEALQEVAREPEFEGLNAAATQAIPWVHVVGPLGSIGEIDDLSSYASVKAETLRKAAEFGDVE